MVLVQQRAGGFRQRCGVAPLRLQLHDQRRLAGEDGQHLLQQGDVMLGALQPVLLQLLRRQILHQYVRTGGTQQGSIVDHRQMAVLHQMHVQLRAEAALYGPAEGGQGVFRDAGLVMIAPVGVVPAAEAVPVFAPAAAQAQEIQQQHEQRQQQKDQKYRHISRSPNFPKRPVPAWPPACCRRGGRTAW